MIKSSREITDFKDCQDKADKLQINYMLTLTFLFYEEMRIKS